MKLDKIATELEGLITRHGGGDGSKSSSGKNKS
jgi:hypothetical protein